MWKEHFVKVVSFYLFFLVHTKASLSMLVEELKHGPESLKLCLEQTSQIDRKLEKISELSYDELQEVFIKET